MTRTRTSAARVVIAAAAITAGGGAQALTLDVHPVLTAGYGYDTNLFRAQSNAVAAATTNGGPRGDQVYRGTVGLELRMTESRQRVSVEGDWGYDHYDQYDELDGSRYNVKGQADLVAGSALGATLTGSSSRILQPYYGGRADIGGGTQTETRGGAELYYKLTPRLSIKPDFDVYRLRLSAPDQRDANLDENAGQLSIEYARETLSAAGIKYRQVEGDYTDRVTVPGDGREKRYTQQTGSGYLRYAPSGLSQFRAELGYTRRSHDDPAVPGYSGLTGKLGYRRVISGLTYGEVEVFRDLQSIDEVGVNFVEETGVSAVLNFAYSVKTALALGYEYLDDRFLGSGAQDPLNNDRRDRIQLLRAGIEYRPTDRIQLTPQVRYEDHSSTREDRTYNYGLFALELKYRY